jgi:hypothetical protein
VEDEDKDMNQDKYKVRERQGKALPVMADKISAASLLTVKSPFSEISIKGMGLKQKQQQDRTGERQREMS